MKNAIRLKTTKFSTHAFPYIRRRRWRRSFMHKMKRHLPIRYRFLTSFISDQNFECFRMDQHNTTQHDKYKYHLIYIRFIRSNETWKISTNVSNYSEIHNTKVEFVQASDGTLNISTMHVKSKKKKLYIFNNTLMEWLVFPNAFSSLFLSISLSLPPVLGLDLILDFWSVLEHVVRVVKITPCLRCRNEEKTRLSNSRVQIYSSFLLIFLFCG